MLPFKNRLVKRKDFENAQKSGLFFSEGNVAIKFAANGLAETRVGFAVGLKFSKKAVERNNAKRQLREIFQKKIGKLKKGVDIIVTARKRDNERINFDKVEKSIDQLLEKSGLIGK